MLQCVLINGDKLQIIPIFNILVGIIITLLLPRNIRLEDSFCPYIQTPQHTILILSLELHLRTWCSVYTIVTCKQEASSVEPIQTGRYFDDVALH